MRAGTVAGSDGVRLAWMAVGDPAAPTVLFGHGVGSSSQFVLDAFGSPFVDAGWQVVAHDLRGHGASSPCTDPAGYGLDVLTGDVGALVAAFEPRVVAGISLSGHVAVAYAAGAPGAVDAVVACLPAWSGISTAGEGPHAIVADTVDEAGVAAMIERFRRDDTLRPWLREVLVRDWARHDDTSLRAALRSLDGGRAPTTQTLASLPVPLALVGWPHDPGHPIAVAEAWCDAAPKATLRTLTLEDLDDELTPFGAAALAALADLGVTP